MKKIEREKLEYLYVERDMTMKQVAEELGVSVGLVHKRIHEYGICVRKGGLKKGHRMPIDAVRRSAAKRKGMPRSELWRHRLSEAKKIHTPGHAKRRIDGYIYIYYPDHADSTRDGYIMEHKLEMEKHIGRRLTKDEVVHHINHKRDDNRIENLCLMTRHDHMSMHMKERWAKKKGVKTYQ